MASRKASKGVWLWPLVSVVMLAGIMAEAGTHVQPADAAKYLEASRKAIDGISLSLVGPTGEQWTGTDVPVAAAATELLRPNTILSRDYVSQSTGQTATLLIVDCSDARDLQGHYPPRCYPAQGQQFLASDQRTW